MLVLTLVHGHVIAVACCGVWIVQAVRGRVFLGGTHPVIPHPCLLSTHHPFSTSPLPIPSPPHPHTTPRSKWQEVLNGRDYLAAASWVLRVPPQLLSQARRVHFWLAPRGSPPGDGNPPSWSSASVQWLEHWPGEGSTGEPAAAAAARVAAGSSGISSEGGGAGGGAARGVGTEGGKTGEGGERVGEASGVVRLGLWSVLLPVGRGAGGPAIVHVKLHWPMITRFMSLRWRAVEAGGKLRGAAAGQVPTGAAGTAGGREGEGGLPWREEGEGNSTAGGEGHGQVAGVGVGVGTGTGTCWRPVLIASDAHGGDEHVRANMTVLPLHFHLHGWPGHKPGGDVEGGGSTGGSSSGSSSSSGGGQDRGQSGHSSRGGSPGRWGGGGEPLVMLVLDPRCGYTLWLDWDVFAPLWTLLLG